MKRLRCFVAMAFDHEDTDHLYNLVIKRVLRDESIEPFRVDRVEHQERIDQFIIDNIGKADFVIADLTYARPSVYYEAGFAERQIPVIYSCRRDHFGGGAKASDGYQLKIHFDLITKNIVAWSNFRDTTFATRLKNRVRFVTEPLKRDRQLVEERRRQVEEFRAKPLSARLERIAEEMKGALCSQGFNLLNRQSRGTLAPENEDDDKNDNSYWISEELNRPTFRFETRYGEHMAQRITGHNLTTVFATVVANLRPTELRAFNGYVYEPPIYNLTPGARVDRVIERYVICSTSKLDIGSAMNQLHQFSRQRDLLICGTTAEVPLHRPAGFQESYKLRHVPYVFVRRRKHAHPIFRVAERVQAWERSKVKPLRVRKVPRILVLSLIGHISRLEEVAERVSSALTTKIEP